MLGPKTGVTKDYEDFVDQIYRGVDSAEEKKEPDGGAEPPKEEEEPKEEGDPC